MKSKALQHYPQVVFKNGIKMLWNPILKQSFVNRPEERVRLSIVEYLIRETQCSSSRISFESPLKLPGDKGSSRTDLICYNDAFEIDLLVECKSTSIRINEKVAQQIGRYNQALGAPYLMITNGLEDVWFQDNENSMDLLSEPPQKYSSTNNSYQRALNYWAERGFVGLQNDDEHPLLLTFAEELYASPNSNVHFLNLGLEESLYADTYYRIAPISTDKKLAIGLSATSQKETCIHCVYNENGMNKVFLSLNFTRFASSQDSTVYMISDEGTTKLDGSSYLASLQSLTLQSFISSIQDMLKLYS